MYNLLFVMGAEGRELIGGFKYTLSKSVSKLLFRILKTSATQNIYVLNLVRVQNIPFLDHKSSYWIGQSG